MFCSVEVIQVTGIPNETQREVRVKEAQTLNSILSPTLSHVFVTVMSLVLK